MAYRFHFNCVCKVPHRKILFLFIFISKDLKSQTGQPFFCVLHKLLMMTVEWWKIKLFIKMEGKFVKTDKDIEINWSKLDNWTDN